MPHGVNALNSFVTLAYDCLVGLVVASATAEQGVLGFSIKDFSVTVTESGFVPG